MKIRITEEPNTITIERNGFTHSAKWADDEELTDIVGSEQLLRAAMIAWTGEPEFELTDEELADRGGGWWKAEPTVIKLDLSRIEMADDGDTTHFGGIYSVNGEEFQAYGDDRGGSFYDDLWDKIEALYGDGTKISETLWDLIRDVVTPLSEAGTLTITDEVKWVADPIVERPADPNTKRLFLYCRIGFDAPSSSAEMLTEQQVRDYFKDGERVGPHIPKEPFTMLRAEVPQARGLCMRRPAAGIQIRRTKWKSLVKLQSKLETLLTRV